MSTSKTHFVEDLAKEPITWVIPDYIPRRAISSIYAPRNAGKTTAAIWLAVEGASRYGHRVWYNSREDDIPTILKPRFDACRVDGGHDLARKLRLTSHSWSLPADLGKIQAELAHHRAGGAPDDLLILDSIQQHISRPFVLAPCRDTMVGLCELARQYDMGVLLLGHTTKGKHASVEAMCQGSTVLQNMSKVIYIFGPEPALLAAASDDDESTGSRLVLACERIGIAEHPVSVLFEKMTTYDGLTGRREPYLRYVGPTDATARDVLDAAKTDARTGNESSKTVQAAYWIMETLNTYGPMPTKDFEAQARGDGVYGSRNTFDRARKIAGVETHKQGNQWWVCLKGQWGAGNSPDEPTAGIGGDGDA